MSLRALRWADAADRLPGGAPLAQSGTPGRDPDRRADPPARARPLGGGGLRARGRAARTGGPPGDPVAGLSPPAVGRPAAAGDDRDGAGLPAAADRGRRADDRPRRDGAGADPGPDLRPGEGSRRRTADHQPRPLGARRRLRPGGRDVRRPRGRARLGRAGVHLPGPPLRTGAVAGVPARGRRRGAVRAGGPRGRPARPARPAAGVCVRAAVCAGRRRVFRRGAAVAGRRWSAGRVHPGGRQPPRRSSPLPQRSSDEQSRGPR